MVLVLLEPLREITAPKVASPPSLVHAGGERLWGQIMVTRSFNYFALRSDFDRSAHHLVATCTALASNERQALLEGLADLAAKIADGVQGHREEAAILISIQRVMQRVKREVFTHATSPLDHNPSWLPAYQCVIEASQER